MSRFSLALLVLVFAWPLAGGAYVSPGRATGLVNDFAGLLTATERQSLETRLAGYQVRSSRELTIVTVDTLAGDTIENFASELFADWQIGKKNQDNGVLLLVANAERELRIEVGYGLEPVLTDAQSRQIIDQLIVPRFKAGDYHAGLEAGVAAIIQTIGGDWPTATSDIPTSVWAVFWAEFGIWIFLPFLWLASILARSKSWWLGGVVGLLVGLGLGWWSILAWWWIIPFGLLGFLFDWAVSRAYTKNKALGLNPPWWAGGSGFGHGGGFGGGGFGGFGGGHSGGGGASGRW